MFISGFQTAYEKYVRAVPANADVIFLDLCRNFDSKDLGGNVTKVNGQFFGLHAYIITRKAIEQFMTHILPIEVQIDAYMSMYAKMAGMNMYTPTLPMCKQYGRPTSIQTTCELCHIDTNSIRTVKKIVFIIFVAILACLVYKNFRKKL